VGQFGDKFRKEREKKGISLDDVSQVTKIGSRMLQAIEEEHFDQLPGGVFNKGFIRAYAKHLGLNDEEAVNSYLACLRQAQIDAHEAWEPARPAPNRPAPPDKRALAASNQVAPGKVPPNKSAANRSTVKAQTPTQVEELADLQLPRAEDVGRPRKIYRESDRGIPWRIVVVAALVIVLALVLWARHSRRTRAVSAASSTTTAPLAPSPTTIPASANQASAARPAIVATASAHPSAAQTQPPLAQSATAVHAPPAKPVASAIGSAAAGSAGNEPTTPRAQATSLPVPASPASALTVVIRASENSWISVLADGQVVSEETLIAPAHTSVRARREIVVKAGNAAGVSFLWNGKEVPAQGAEAEVKTFVFDVAGMRVMPPAPAPTQNP
jgi:cytoskeletal protein RodZ